MYLKIPYRSVGGIGEGSEWEEITVQGIGLLLSSQGTKILSLI
jgi:hypothetical protein